MFIIIINQDPIQCSMPRKLQPTVPAPSQLQPPVSAQRLQKPMPALYSFEAGQLCPSAQPISPAAKPIRCLIRACRCHRGVFRSQKRAFSSHKRVFSSQRRAFSSPRGAFSSPRGASTPEAGPGSRENPVAPHQGVEFPEYFMGVLGSCRDPEELPGGSQPRRPQMVINMTIFILFLFAKRLISFVI